MPNNKLTDLNDYLFAQMETLSSENLTEKELEFEVKRTRQLVSVSDRIIKNATLVLQATKIAGSGNVKQSQLPSMIGLNQENK